MQLIHAGSDFPTTGGDAIRFGSVPGAALAQPGDKWFPKDNAVEANRVCVRTENGFTTVRAEVAVKTQTFFETVAFCSDRPAAIELRLDSEVQNVLAWYLFKDWWTRPAFADSLAGLPTRCELLLIRAQDGYLAAMAAPGEGAHIQFAPSGDAGTLRAELYFTQSGRTRFAGPVCYAYQAADPYDAMEGLMRRLCEVYRVPEREQKSYPAALETLGWCSWDAFYRDVTAEKLLDKCREARDKGIPFGWMLIDDGWMSVDGEERLTAWQEDRQKFPDGLADCVARMKELCGVRTVGVWHAFAGYWNGVAPDSPLYEQQRENLIRNGRGQWLPAPEAGKAFRFFGAWHQYLQSAGIDLVKVDSQSTMQVHYRGSAALGPAAAALHQGLDASTAVWMGGRLINCMGMAKENVFGRPASAVSRNSDDFFPRVEGSFEEHLLQNAYNSLYHSVLYYTDWDMFWTSHPQAEKHALLRALSGGPVYVSDPVGESHREILDKLCYADGAILRAPQPAVPTGDCLFADPAQAGILKLKNECGVVRYLAAFAYGDACREAAYTVGELRRTQADADAQSYAVYDVTTAAGRTARPGDGLTIPLRNGFAFAVAAPIERGVAVFGRADKYLMSHAVQRILRTQGRLMIVLREAGELLFYAETPPRAIVADGLPCDVPAGENGFYRLTVPGTTVEILW